MSAGSSRRVRSTALFVLLAVGAVATVFPLAYMISTSLKGPVYVFEMPPRLLPEPATIQNYVRAFAANDFGRYFMNSVKVSVVSVFFTLALASCMAYALARYRFAGRRLLYSLIIFFMAVPAMSLIVPQFVLAHTIGVTDSLAGLILWNIAQNLPFAIFLLTTFIASVPKEIEEAAEIDGASAWGRYRTIALPLSRPALATAAIFAFLGSWDEYVWASTTINTPAYRTLPVAIATFQGVHTTNWGLVFAASVIAIVPILVLFVVLQRYFVKGIVGGAVKG